MAVYLPPSIVHPDRYGGYRAVPPRILTLHTSQGSEGVASAQALSSYMGRPGDRDDKVGGLYGSSYHYVFDLQRCVRPAVPENRVAYANVGANDFATSGVFPGRAEQSYAQWTDAISADYLTTAASWIVDESLKWGIDYTRHLTDAELRAGRNGYVDHHAITRVYAGSHVDVGPNFPWDLLAAQVELFAIAEGLHTKPHPPPPPPVSEDDMPIIAKWKDVPTRWIVIDGTCWRYLTPGLTEPDTLVALKLARYVDESYPGAIRGTGGRIVAVLDRDAGFGIGDALRNIPQVGAP